MTVPPEPDIPGDTPEMPNPDVPDDPDDIATSVPEGDRAAQSASAWPDDDEQDIVPDGDRVVPDLGEDT